MLVSKFDKKFEFIEIGKNPTDKTPQTDITGLKSKIKKART